MVLSWLAAGGRKVVVGSAGFWEMGGGRRVSRGWEREVEACQPEIPSGDLIQLELKKCV
jgi:hypothetical protein